jgi:hypothetical protein
MIAPLMFFLLTIYNKLTPTPTIFEFFCDVGLEFEVFRSLVSIDKVALKLLRSKLYLFKKIVMPIKLLNPLLGGAGTLSVKFGNYVCQRTIFKGGAGGC